MNKLNILKINKYLWITFIVLLTINQNVWAGPNLNAACYLDLDYTTRQYDSNNMEKDIESKKTINEGEEIYVTVVAHNVSNLDTYQVELSYDPSRMQLLDKYEDIPFIGINNLLKANKGQTVGFQAAIKEPGLINISNALAGKNHEEAPEGSGIIAILKFKVLDNKANNILTLSNVYYVNSNEISDKITNLKHAVFNPDIEKNNPPIAVDDKYYILCNTQTQIQLLENDSDTDGDDLEIINYTSPKNGTINKDANHYTYTPNKDFIGMDSFMYTISDGNGYTASANVSIDIYSNQLRLELNKVQAITNNTASFSMMLLNPEKKDIKGIYAVLNYDESLIKTNQVTLNNSELENSNYTIQYSDSNGEMIISIYSNTNSYFNASGMIANLIFDVVGNCGKDVNLAFNKSEINELQVDSLDGNLKIISTPTITNIDDQNILEDNSTETIAFSITDCDNDNHKVVYNSDNIDLIPNNDSNIQIIGSGNQRKIKIIPVHNKSGSSTIVLTAIDDDGLTALTSFKVNVSPVSDKPDLIVDSQAKGIANTDIPLNIQASLNDLDGSESISVKVSDIPTKAKLTKGKVNPDGSWDLSILNLNQLNIIPPEDFVGSFTITVSATSEEIDNDDKAIVSETIEVICSGYEISGIIKYYSEDKPVRNVKLILKGEKTYNVLTDSNGRYSIKSVIPGDYELVPEKKDDLGGLSNTDAGYIGLSIIKKFDLNYMQKIAADVTQNKSIRPTDASNVSVAATPGNGVDCVNENCVNWVFLTDKVDKPISLSYTSKRQYPALDSNKDNQDFIAIRLGDVNGNWNVSEE